MDVLHELHRQLDDIIDERLRLHATSPDTCPDDMLTAMISRKPPVSQAKRMLSFSIHFLSSSYVPLCSARGRRSMTTW
jgi:hypothetical protein